MRVACDLRSLRLSISISAEKLLFVKRGALRLVLGLEYSRREDCLGRNDCIREGGREGHRLVKGRLGFLFHL